MSDTPRFTFINVFRITKGTMQKMVVENENDTNHDYKDEKRPSSKVSMVSPKNII